MNHKRLLELIVIGFVLFFVSSSHISAQYLNFSKAGELKYTMASNSVFVLNDISFINIAGADSGLYPSSETYNLNSQGDVSSIADQLSLPELVLWQAYSNYANNLYILGGTNGSLQPTDNVWRTKYSNGFLSPWQILSKLPQAISLGSSIQYKGVIYFAGGYKNFDSDPTNSVYYSKIIDDEHISEWIPTSSLPLDSAGFTLIAYGDYLYAIGKQDTPHVFFSKINSDGSLEAWSYSKSLPGVRYRASVVNVGNKIFVIGGIESIGYSAINSIYYSEIGPTGQLADWRYLEEFPRNQCCSPAVNINGKLYVPGGHDGINYYKEIYKSNNITDIPDIPTPTPSFTPSPTPTPIIVPVTKVILIPGFGGSWNTDALVNCKSSDYEGEWVISPFAKDIYNPIQRNLALNGKDVYMFTYDWRRDVRENAYRLSEYVSSITSPFEKVDLLGHSMGGLVARSYVEDGGFNKVNSFMSVGAPHLGMVRAYELWSAADVYHENLLYKIAQFILMKSCSNDKKTSLQTLRENIPSIQNLLPVFDYIRESSSGVKPYKEMTIFNNWLPTDYLSLLIKVRVGTISGTGYSTLSEIKTKSPSKIDVQRGYWIDGKPAQLIKTKQGDNTVLLSSSQLIGAQNIILNQNHIGIISSKESIYNILNFFNALPVHESFLNKNSDSNYGVVVICKNSEISLNGEVYTDIGVVMNKKAGKFKVNINTHKGAKNLQVYQFLSNGSVMSSDYAIDEMSTTKWLLEFDIDKPKTNILMKL